jgi:uncharacterized protein YndB with AHSA1/START domain
MATIEVTPDQDAVLAEIHIAAPPERVFQAISDPSQLKNWWGQKGKYRHTDAQFDVRPGGKWRTAGAGDDGEEFHVSGNIWKSIRRACWYTPGPPVSTAERLLPSAGS